MKTAEKACPRFLSHSPSLPGTHFILVMGAKWAQNPQSTFPRYLRLTFHKAHISQKDQRASLCCSILLNRNATLEEVEQQITPTLESISEFGPRREIWPIIHNPEVSLQEKYFHVEQTSVMLKMTLKTMFFFLLKFLFKW